MKKKQNNTNEVYAPNIEQSSLMKDLAEELKAVNKTETHTAEEEVSSSQKIRDIEEEKPKKPKLPKLRLNLVGLLYLTTYRSKTLSPLEKVLLSFITGLTLDENTPEEKCSRFTGFNEAHFKYYAEKYNNHFASKIRATFFKKLSESLQAKRELSITFDFLGRANVTLNKKHTNGCCVPIFEIDAYKRIATEMDYLFFEDNLNNEPGYNKNFDYNYTAWLILSGLLKCANQSLVECEGFYVSRVQIIKLATLVQIPEAVFNDAMTYLFKIQAVFTKSTLHEEPEQAQFSLYSLIKNDSDFDYLYINEHLVSSYMSLFPNYDILHYAYEVSRSASAFTGKYR